MARTSNRQAALSLANTLGVVVTVEGDGVELWGRVAHMSEQGTHFAYVNREDFNSDPAIWAEVREILQGFRPCAGDCECRQDQDQDQEHQHQDQKHQDQDQEHQDQDQTVCDACGNSGNVADFMASHECVTRQDQEHQDQEHDDYVGTCLQCGTTFHAATPANVPAARAAMLICCETPIVDCDFEDYSACPVCGDPIDYCQGHGELGDPRGYAILTDHDNGNHDRCATDCEGN